MYCYLQCLLFKKTKYIYWNNSISSVILEKSCCYMVFTVVKVSLFFQYAKQDLKAHLSPCSLWDICRRHDAEDKWCWPCSLCLDPAPQALLYSFPAVGSPPGWAQWDPTASQPASVLVLHVLFSDSQVLDTSCITLTLINSYTLCWVTELEKQLFLSMGLIFRHVSVVFFTPDTQICIRICCVG